MDEEIKKENTYVEYKREIITDLEVDRITLEEKQLKLPAIKGKWIARLMNHKKEIDKLWELYNQSMKTLTKKVVEDSPIKISNKVAQGTAKDHDLILKIKKEIKDHERIVEYLEKMEKVFSSMSYDMANLINLIKLETT